MERRGNGKEKRLPTKKAILPDAFVTAALLELDVPERDAALFREFVRMKADSLDELWADFLMEEDFERLMERKPSMRTMIRHTPLSNRVKNALEMGGVSTVGHLVQYSPSEIRRFRRIGDDSLREIVAYLKSVGFALPD